jgi:hypothetical protein
MTPNKDIFKIPMMLHELLIKELEKNLGEPESNAQLEEMLKLTLAISLDFSSNVIAKTILVSVKNENKQEFINSLIDGFTKAIHMHLEKLVPMYEAFKKIQSALKDDEPEVLNA